MASLTQRNDSLIKQEAEHKETTGTNTPRDVESEEVNTDLDFERRTMRKVDWRLLPVLGATYAIALVDRGNISAARVAGMQVDLKLSVGDRYSIISLLFFVPYIILELPSNLVIRKIGCRNLLAGIAIAWGAVMLGMGFINTWEQLAVCRVLLGALEAGFFPGCVFLISCWYQRYEVQKRMAAFYMVSMVASGVANIVAWAMSQLGGRYGIAAWRWIFILFGVITIALGIMGIFLIVDFPDKATFLTPSQTAVVIQRINLDRGDAEDDGFTWGKVLKHLGDLKIWAFALIFMAATTPSYAFSYFLPLVLGSAGFDYKMSLILACPPYVFAAIQTFIVAYFADRTRMRAPFILFNSVLCTAGLLILAFGKISGVRYFGSFIALSSCQANLPAIMAYQANNVLTHSKRAVASAVVIGFGGVGGIFASLVFRQKDSPTYVPGIVAAVCCQGMSWILLGLLTWHFRRANKRADETGEGIDGNVNFRYTI